MCCYQMAGPRRLACGLRRFAWLCAAAAALLKQSLNQRLESSSGHYTDEFTRVDTNANGAVVTRKSIRRCLACLQSSRLKKGTKEWKKLVNSLTI